VMAHFCLSMLILVAAVALAWRARHPRGHRAPSLDRASVWAVRALLPLGAITILAGTAATAAGPHAGGMNDQRINRLDFKGTGTLDWAIHQHARIALALGLATAGVWWLLRRRGGDPAVRRSLTISLALLAAQGAVGTIQYALHLPAEIVWVHVSLASVTWLSLLWATAQAGRLAPRAAPVAEPSRPVTVSSAPGRSRSAV
jgi:heme a synthase